MKLKILKYLSLMIVGALIMGIIAGCAVYTKEDLAEYTKRRLKEEYGEDFEIKTVKGAYETVAYPVNDPELLFKTWYVMSNGNGYNHYLQAIVEKQLKKLIEEKLEDFEYEYYVDVDVDRKELPEEVATDITIEQYDELIGETKPTYHLFLSCNALSQTDEDLYELIESIISIHNCFIGIYFLTDEDFEKILENYSNYAMLETSMCNYLNLTKKYNYIGSSVKEDGMWKIDLEDFKQQMKEVRKNELY